MLGWVAALLLLLCLGGVIGLILWNKTKTTVSDGTTGWTWI